MKRRDFLKALFALIVSSKIVYDEVGKQIQKSDINRIYTKLPNHVHLAESVNYIKSEEGGKKQVREGYGIIVKQHYLTLNHIVDASELQVMSQFGLLSIHQDVIKKEVSIKKGKIAYSLEEVLIDKEKDIAIYKMPDNSNIPDFPARIGEARLGERVYIIGNPMLKGFNIREARISDIDDFEKGNKCFGVGKAMVPGDSGTPVISEDLKLIGLCDYTAFGLGYAVKIQEFLNKIK